MAFQSAFEVLAAAYYGEIYRYCCLRLKNRKQAAEDCTQEVFLTMLRKQDQLDFSMNIRAWLYITADKIIGNYLKKEVRREQNRIPLYDLDQYLGGTDGGISAVTDELPESESPLRNLTEEEYALLAAYYEADRGEREALARKNHTTLAGLYNKIKRIKDKIDYPK